MNYFNNLFILEMANNHFGDVAHGKKIIQSIKEECKDFPFRIGIKFQYRSLDTFIHKDFAGSEHKQVKRFCDTKLSPDQFLMLKREVQVSGFVTICTPFDEPSVDLIVQHGYDIIKIASCSFTDWPLLEKIASTNLPIIASAAGATLEDIDSVVSFFKHRNKEICLMHCVGEYPTDNNRLQLNQIDLLKQRYEGVAVGFSTHEAPENFDSIKIAVAKGAKVFERHIGLDCEQYPLNAYSSSPSQIRNWLTAAEIALDMCGVSGERYTSTEKENSDLQSLRRGVFAKKSIIAGEKLDSDAFYYAFPNKEGQLLANDISKYMAYEAIENIDTDKPVMTAFVEKTNQRQKVAVIVDELKRVIEKSGVSLPRELEVEISHHYGLDNYYEHGLAMLTLINREYSKKVLIILPGQKNPTHHHLKKEETFCILYGDFITELDGVEKELKAGQMVTVERGVKHNFTSKTGCVLEEISTTHYKDDSYYEDERVTNNKNRKTELKFWVE